MGETISVFLAIEIYAWFASYCVLMMGFFHCPFLQDLEMRFRCASLLTRTRATNGGSLAFPEGGVSGI
jgi:hypothetical protein